MTAILTNSPPFHMQPVDIIIPYHGEYDKVARLMESIFKTVRTNRYQITLVDDASANAKFIASFKKIPGVVTTRHPKQLGFGAAVNSALKITKQPFVLIMQSDVVVEGNKWLYNLGESLYTLKQKNVKMVSPLTDKPLVDDKRMVAGKREFRDDVILEDGFLPMYCFLCHRELFKRVGPMKECPYAGGEAQEFAARMKSAGYLQGICGSSWVHHEGRATLKKYDERPKIQEILRKSLQSVECEVNALKK